MLLVPGYFFPSMLVCNAMEGARRYSIWTGIRDFYNNGHTYLAALIFTFSMVFPLVKLVLCLCCAGGIGWLGQGIRERIARVTSWTAKYSMLDVLVIAMAVMLVKVGDYVRVLPSVGIYLFSGAVVFSGAASWALSRGLRAEREERVGRAAAWWRVLPFLLGGGWLGAEGYHKVLGGGGGEIDRISLTRLVARGDMKRFLEKGMALKDVAQGERKFWSKDTFTRLVEAAQSISTDAGWQTPDVFVRAVVRDPVTHARRTVDAPVARQVDLDAKDFSLEFTLPERIGWQEFYGVKLISQADFGFDAKVEEEYVAKVDDAFFPWTRDWPGRIFQFHLHGPRGVAFTLGVAQLCIGVVALLWALSAWIARPRGVVLSR